MFVTASTHCCPILEDDTDTGRAFGVSSGGVLTSVESA
jgi:hypothetical protein